MFSSTATAQKRPSPAFDPTADCVFEHQKKKKGARNKTSKITLVLIHDIKAGIPRGAVKDKLLEEGRMMKVDIARHMRPTQVWTVFLNALKVKAYKLLDVFGQKLGVASNQDPDGDDIVESASKKKGNMLYVTEVKDKV